MASADGSLRTLKLVVFDLDLTLWPFRLDKHFRSPFLHDKGGKVEDSSSREVELFEETLAVLEYVKEEGYLMGIASRIEDVSGAYQLINLLGLASYFMYREIYPGPKRRHFQSLRMKSQVDYPSMIFFDDDLRNIRSVSQLGVTCIHVPNGIGINIVRSAIESLNSKKGHLT